MSSHLILRIRMPEAMVGRLEAQNIAGRRLLDLSARVEQRRDLRADAPVMALLLVRRAKALVRGSGAGNVRAIADAWQTLAPDHPLTAVYAEAAEATAICHGMTATP